MVPMSRSDGLDRMPSWAEVRAFAEHAEAIGVDSVWVCDHLLSGPPGQSSEGWTLLQMRRSYAKRRSLGL